MKVSDLKYAPYNPRKIDDKELAKLKRSITEFGYVEPIIWNKRTGFVVGGNQRLKVLRELGIEEVDIVVVDLDDAKEKALNVALNKISGEWDFIKLKDVLTDIDTGDFDIELTGFDLDEIENLITFDKEPEEDNFDADAAIDEIEEPKTKRGDIYLLGKHRLMCGDSTVKEDVEKLMDGKKADMVFTDPPYGVDYEGNYIQSGKILKKQEKIWSGGIKNDNLDDFGAWLKRVFDNVDSFMQNGCSIYIWHPSGESSKCFWQAWPFVKWHFQVEIIWNKMSLIISRWDYKPQHEPCMYGWKGTSRNWSGANNEPTVWDLPRQQGNSGEKREHPTAKPLGLAVRAIKNHNPNLVFDFFGGSGSTLIACEQLNRICYMMELDEKYCDVIVRRWEEFTGKKAQLMRK